jgi:hypothetical protein
MGGSKDYYPADGSPPVPMLGSWPLLHDLSIDPQESYNLAPRHPERVQAMTSALREWHWRFLAEPRGWIATD